MKSVFAFLLLNIISIALVHSVIPDEAGQGSIEAIINNLRRTASPTGTNMREVSFEECLARAANNYLAQCNPPGTRNPNIQSDVAAECGTTIPPGLTIGESVFNTTQPGTHNPFSVWGEQRNMYDYAANTCTPQNGCRDYLELVNGPTYAVGCANFDESACGRTGLVFTCYHAGSPGSGRPYTDFGPLCSQCTPDWSGPCNLGLCTQGTSTNTPTVSTNTPTVSTNTPTISTVTIPSNTPTDHDHDHDGHKHHDHGHKHHDHGHKSHDHDQGTKSHDQGTKSPGNTHEHHDHHRGHKSHDHNHGNKAHDHAHQHGKSGQNDDNSNDNSASYMGVFAESSSATTSSIMGLLLIASILLVLFSSL